MNAKLAFVLVSIISAGCSSSDSKVVSNKVGRYSITVLSGWDYKFDGSKTIITKTVYFGTSYVIGTLTISEGPTEYNSLDETLDNYLQAFKYTFKDFVKLSEGYADINGLRSRWFRMRDNENGTIYETVQYVIQQSKNRVFVLNSSATKEKFKNFEEDFQKMIFTYSRLG